MATPQGKRQRNTLCSSRSKRAADSTVEDLENLNPSHQTSRKGEILATVQSSNNQNNASKRKKLIAGTTTVTSQNIFRGRKVLDTVSNQKQRLGTPRVFTEISLELNNAVHQSNSPNFKAFSTASLYQEAKSLFRRTAIPTRLVGRISERAAINSFCQKHVLGNIPGSLYISGSPGTGKTAMLMEIMKNMEVETGDKLKCTHTVKIIMVNCMSLADPKAIYTKILNELNAPNTEKDVAKQAEEIILDGKKDVMYVIILDEIDHLLTKDQDVLYKIFEWTTIPSARLTLFGIANALDMTDRFLPRLRAKNCEPQLLNFNPYQVSEIADIIRDRLCSLRQQHTILSDTPPIMACTTPQQVPLMQTQAIELCARKVAAANGDLRKALDVCRQAIEMVESEIKRKQLEQQHELHSLSRTPPLSMVPSPCVEQAIKVVNVKESHFIKSSSHNLDEAPKVTITHVLKVLTMVFGSPTVQKIKELNFQHKVVLGTLIIMGKMGRAKVGDITLGKYYDQYLLLCTKSKLVNAVTRTEFSDLVAMLEVAGFISLARAKEERARRVILLVQESEVMQAISEVSVIKRLMEEAIHTIKGSLKMKE